MEQVGAANSSPPASRKKGGGEDEGNNKKKRKRANARSAAGAGDGVHHEDVEGKQQQLRKEETKDEEGSKMKMKIALHEASKVSGEGDEKEEEGPGADNGEAKGAAAAAEEESSPKKRRKSIDAEREDRKGKKSAVSEPPSTKANKSTSPRVGRKASPSPSPPPALMAAAPPIHTITNNIKIATPILASTSPAVPPPFSTTPAWMTNKKKGPHKRYKDTATPASSYASPAPAPPPPPSVPTSSAHLIKNIINLPPFQPAPSTMPPPHVVHPTAAVAVHADTTLYPATSISSSISTSLPSSPPASPPTVAPPAGSIASVLSPPTSFERSFSPAPSTFSLYPTSTSSPSPSSSSSTIATTSVPPPMVGAPAQLVAPGTVGVLASAPLWAQKMAERRALLAKNLSDSYALVVDYVESMMIELEGEKEAAIRLIALEQARLEDERRQWEEDKTRMAAVQQFASNKVRLNIGGQIFETTRSTLLKDPDHMLARMFSGRFEVTRDEHDAVFIDRDSSVFGLVLNFLRSNELSVSPREEGTLWKLLEEAKFYQIQPLVDCVKDKLGMRYVWYADWQQVCNSTEKFYQSPIFIVGGWPWRLSLVRDEGWLGISLTVSKRARQLPKGWRMNASFAVDIKNADPKKVSASMQHSDAQLDEARTGIFWRHCYELEKLALDGVIADDKLIISAEIKIESCTLLD